MRSILNFNHLETFLSVANSLSFSQAAKDLGIAQPAISKQIKSLEHVLESQLFLREAREVVLTKKGEELFKRMNPIFGNLNNEFNDFKNEQVQLEGKITFGCLQEVGERLIFAIILSFIKKFPKIEIDVRYLKSFEIVDEIKSGEIDIGLIAKDLNLESIRVFKVLEERISLIAASKWKIGEIDSLKDLPVIKYRENDILLTMYLKKFYPKSQISKLNTLISVNSHKNMLEALSAYPAMAALPELSYTKELMSGKFVRLSAKSMNTSLYLAQPAFDYPDKKVDAFKSHLIKSLKTS